jgi:hypothetical protein
MQSLRKIVTPFLQEIRSNRNLQYGLLAIALLACIELALGWSDALSAKEKQLQQLRGELRTLRNQSRDEGALRRQLVELERIKKIVDERLWIVSSDAVGQARLKDWLTAILKKAGAKNFNLVLSSPRAAGGREGSAVTESAATGAGKSESSTASMSSVDVMNSVNGLREVRANITLVFTPATLEQILSDIEGGEPLATVESLNVSRRDRKVEMTIRVLMQIGRQEAPGSPALNDAGVNAELNSSDPKLPLTSSEKTAGSVSIQQSASRSSEVKR